MTRILVIAGGLIGAAATIGPWLAKSGNIQTDLWFALGLAGALVFVALFGEWRAPPSRWPSLLIAALAIFMLALAGLNISLLLSKLAERADDAGAVSTLISERLRLWVACYLIVATAAAAALLGAILARKRVR